LRRHSSDDFRVVKYLAYLRGKTLGLVHRNAWREVNVHPHRPFIQLRKKLASKVTQREETRSQQEDRSSNDNSLVCHRPVECRPINTLAGPNDKVLSF